MTEVAGVPLLGVVVPTRHVDGRVVVDHPYADRPCLPPELVTR